MWPGPRPRPCRSPHPAVRARVAQHAVTAEQVVAHETRDAILPLASRLKHLRLSFSRRLPDEIVHLCEKEEQGEGVRAERTASRTQQPRSEQLEPSPVPFKAMLPWSLVGSPEVTQTK